MLSIFSSNFPENETKEDQRDFWKSLKWEITECIKTFCLRKLVRLMGDHFRRQRMEEKRGCKSEEKNCQIICSNLFFAAADKGD